MKNLAKRQRGMLVWMLLLGMLLAASSSVFAQEQNSEEAPEVVLDAYSSGFYRPGLLMTSELDSSLDQNGRAIAGLFAERLRYALVWSGYITLITPEDARFMGPRETPGYDTPPEMELTLALSQDESGGLLARARISEIAASPFYAGKIPFTGDDVRGKADIAAEEILRQLTGMTPPFRSRIVAVEEFPGNIKELMLLDYDGSNKWRLTRDNSIALSPCWSSDGKNIVFASFRGGDDADLYIIDLTQGRIRRLLQRVGTDVAAQWSPDGKWIVFAGSSGPETHLYLIKPDGSGLRRLTRGPWIDTSPSWSPDSRKLVFMSDRSGNPQIYRMNVDGTDVRRLTYQGNYNADPAWSPAGDRIVYARLTDRGFQLRSMDPLGDVDVALTDEYNDHLDPSWSPDGMKITYNWRDKVWVMSADGTLRRPLLSDGLMPDWSPIPARR